MQILQGKPRGLIGSLFRLLAGGWPGFGFRLHGLGPVALVGDVEPAPDLRIPVVREDIPADDLVVIPNRLGLAVVDPGCAARLLAEVEAFLIAEEEVAFDGAARGTGQTDTCGGAPERRT